MEPDTPGKPVYKPPHIVTYDEAALLRVVGLAGACARWDSGRSSDAPSAERQSDSEVQVYAIAATVTDESSNKGVWAGGVPRGEQ